MFRFKCSYLCWCVVVALWTIVKRAQCQISMSGHLSISVGYLRTNDKKKIQTAAHSYGIVYVMWWRDCTIDPDSKEYYLLYLTYFFTRQCENETRFALATNRNVILTILDNSKTNATEDLDGKLDTLILTYLILDALWIISSVALLTGACLKIREVWSLPFYVPWILMDAIILFFDGFCSIFFGLHIPENGTIFDWLHFIGINVRFNEVKKLEGDMPSLVTGAASVIMMFISARGIIVWIINLALMVVVIKAARRAYRKPTPTTTRRRNGTFSASERIRKWNQFYGSVDGQRNETNRRRRNVFDGESEEGRDTAAAERRMVARRIVRSDAEGAAVDSINTNSNSEDAKKARDVAKDFKVAVERVPMKEMRGQVPWSYVNLKPQVETVRPDIVPEGFYAKGNFGVKGLDEGVSKL